MYRLFFANEPVALVMQLLRGKRSIVISNATTKIITCIGTKMFISTSQNQCFLYGFISRAFTPTKLEKKIFQCELFPLMPIIIQDMAAT